MGRKGSASDARGPIFAIVRLALWVTEGCLGRAGVVTGVGSDGEAFSFFVWITHCTINVFK